MVVNTKMWDDPTIKESIEYSMPKELATILIRSEKKKVPDHQQFLCDYVNREFGLKGHVTSVILY